MDIDKPLIRETNVLVEELDGEMLAVNLDTMTTTAISQHGAIVWSLCDGTRTAQEVINVLIDAYPKQQESIQSDVIETLSSLRKAGLILA